MLRYVLVTMSGCVLNLLRQVEIVAFSDEEGVRFQSTFLGSKVVAGTLPRSALNVTDAAGVTLAEVRTAGTIAAACLDAHASCAQALRPGADLDALYADVRSQAATPGSVRAYVEVHIEQGPVLEGVGLPVGVVSAIAGQTRLAVSVSGEQGHAGTVPMSLRRDALAGAAAAIVLIEQRCKSAASDASHFVPALLRLASAQVRLRLKDWCARLAKSLRPLVRAM